MDQGDFTMDISVDIDFEEEDVEGTISAGDFGTFPLTGSKSTPENH